MRSILLILALTAAASAQSVPTARYTVGIDPELETLHVRACFKGEPPAALEASSPHAPAFIEVDGAEGARRLPLDDVPRGGCMDYDVDVFAIAALGRRAALGGWVGGNLVIVPSLWLWLPEDPNADIELHFDLPEGVRVSAPWSPLEGDGFRVSGRRKSWPATVVFGDFEQRILRVPGAELHLAVLNAEPAADADAIEKWLTDAAHAVAQLYGRFPVERVQVVVEPQGHQEEAVPYAEVQRGGGPSITFYIDQHRPLREFLADWTATHEFSHFLHPYIHPRDAWLSEGIATYYQNVLGARSGRLSAREAWQNLHEGFERGRRDDRHASLAEATENMYRDDAYTRVYWSGAAIMLLADLRLRTLSGGKQSLDTALAALAECCLLQVRTWLAREVMARLDELTQTRTFSELYREHVNTREFPDLSMAYRQLGLSEREESIRYQDGTDAALRDAIMQGH